MAAAVGLLLAGCMTGSIFDVIVWAALLVSLPFIIIALPVYPLYYAIEGPAGNIGTKTVCFAPDGNEVVVTYETRKDMHLYRVALDGTFVEQLTKGDRYDFDPVYSPDGQSLVFASRVGRSQSNLFSYEFTSKAIVQLTEGEFEDWCPQFSPNGSTIVFSRREREKMADLYLVDANGQNLTPLTPDERVHDIGPAFLPDDETILFARLDELPKWGPKRDTSWDEHSLYAVARTGEDVRKVADARSVYAHPAQQVVEEQPVLTNYAGRLIVCNPDAIAVLRAAGVEDIPVGHWTKELSAYTNSVFSPDGRRVAFTRSRKTDDEERRCTLQVALTTEDATRTIVEKRDTIADPVFSPDGSRLVFRVKRVTGNDRSHSELWTVRFDGTGLQRLPVTAREERRLRAANEDSRSE